MIEMRSPNWKPEELKIALALYLSKDIEWLAKIHDKTYEIQMTSRLLNSMDFYNEPKPENFRSPGSIRMKLANFKALDERYGKSSLSNIGTLDKAVWDNYHNNYTVLKKECEEIINNHYVKKEDKDLEEYLSKLFDSSTSKNIEDTFYTFAEKCYQEAEKILFQVSELYESEELSRITRTCISIMKATKWCHIDEKHADESNEDPYKEHGGINLAPIDKAKGSSKANEEQEKIGKHVRSAMEQLIKEGKVDKRMTQKLTTSRWSKDVLHLGHPLLCWIDTSKPLKEQIKDDNGYTRYWVKPYNIGGEQYCICKEWYESSRKHFDKWIESLSDEKKGELEIASSTLVEVLKYIKKIDEKQTCISRQALFEEMKEVNEKETLLSQMISMGLLAAFQGTERELVVDDYDLLFDMISYPEEYVV